MSASAPVTAAIDDAASQDADATAILYETDSYGWTMQQIEHLRAGRREALDLPHLTQILVNLASGERTKLTAALEQTIEALLKWDFASQNRSRAWTLTIHQQRRRILKQMRRQPGLMETVPETLHDAYGRAQAAVTEALGLDIDTLPRACPYDWAAVTERPVE